MSFFKFRQNNSGGSFDIDDKVTIAVWIEADSFDEANAKAESIGIYFDGCESGMDCDCCGDRWSAMDDWNTPEEQPVESKYDSFWVREGVPYTYIYLKDGTKKTWTKESENETI